MIFQNADQVDYVKSIVASFLTRFDLSFVVNLEYLVLSQIVAT